MLAFRAFALFTQLLCCSASRSKYVSHSQRHEKQKYEIKQDAHEKLKPALPALLYVFSAASAASVGSAYVTGGLHPVAAPGRFGPQSRSQPWKSPTRLESWKVLDGLDSPLVNVSRRNVPPHLNLTMQQEGPRQIGRRARLADGTVEGWPEGWPSWPEGWPEWWPPRWPKWPSWPEGWPDWPRDGTLEVSRWPPRGLDGRRQVSRRNVSSQIHGTLQQEGPHRRALLAGGLLGLASVFNPSMLQPAFAQDPTRISPEDGRKEVPPGVVVLRIAEVTDKMENIMLEQAAYLESGKGEELPIGRPQMQQSIDILLKRTKLAEIPNSRLAVERLQSISLIAEKGEGALTAGELKQMAKAYSQARDELRVVFEAFSQDQRQEFKQIFQRMQEADRAFMREGQ